jgi:pyridoxal phosphate enzyme (YggS family)
MTRSEEIAHNLALVRERVSRAEAAAGRAAGSVTLIAVSKTMPAEDVAAAHAAGQVDFGENYGQELRDKRQALTALPLRWHFIGPLQTNKVKYVAGQVALVHTLDSPPLLVEVDRRAGAVQECLIQVNVAAEPQKRGVAVAELPALLARAAELPHLRCVGLMVIPPVEGDPRPHFAALRRLRDEAALTELSMGMSQDLEVAIAEGATLVRVGTAIFGERRRA